MSRKNILILIILIACVSVPWVTATAQQATAKVTVQPVEIEIGQQSVISLEVIAPKGRQIVFPVYEETLVNGIEVLGMPKVDTVIAHEVMTLTQQYIVTSFDSALYHVPYMPVLDGTDTIRSNGFGLKVTSPLLTEQSAAYLEEMAQNQTDSIDLEKLGIYDIKAVQEPPFVWQDYIMYGLMLLGFLLVLAALIVGIWLYRQKKDKGYFFTPKIVEPPHVVALNALNHLKEEKKWMNGREKEYYTEMTDILRKYIEDRFHVGAFEKTSDEILTTINNFVEAESSYDSLQQVLKLSDLVKFAKYKPLPNENDLSLVNSILFVNQTKVEPPKPEDNPADENKPADGKEETGSKEIRKYKSGVDEDDEPIDWTVSRDQKLFDDDDKPIKR